LDARRWPLALLIHLGGLVLALLMDGAVSWSVDHWLFGGGRLTYWQHLWRYSFIDAFFYLGIVAAQPRPTAGVADAAAPALHLESLRAAAAKSDGVIHLKFIHDFSNYAESARNDDRAIEALGTALEGSGRPLVIASGLLGLKPGQLLTERDQPPSQSPNPRFAGVRTALSFVARGVRTSILRLSPSVHGPGDHGFMATIIKIAREKGVSAYIGDGQNRWPGVHRLDAARLFRLALEKAPAGSALHAAADEGVPIRAVAEVIGRHLKLPVAHFGWMGAFLALDSLAASVLTRELLGWQPPIPAFSEYPRSARSRAASASETPESFN